MTKTWTLAAAGACLLLTAGIAGAQGGGTGGAGGSAAPAGQTVEEIAAVVGGTPILASMVEEQVEILSQQFQLDPGDTAATHRLQREVLQDLIDNQLLQLEADARGVKATDAEVEAEVDRAIEGNIRALGGREGFRAQLEKEKLTEATLRSRYREEARKRIVAQKLVQQEIRPKIAVTEEMSRRFFEENRAELPKKPRSLRIQDLFIRTQADSLTVQRARQTALEVRQKVLAGAVTFEQAAEIYSDDPRAKEGGPLGRFEKGELDPDLEGPAFALGAGEVSQPVRTRFGFHLLKAVATDPAGAWVELQHILIAITPNRADEAAARERALSIRRDVAAGTLDFGEAIRRLSDDPEAKTTEGDLGWIPIDSFFGEMRQVADTLRVGRISPPVGGDGGYHVFKILGEQAEGPYAYEEIADQMTQLAGQKEMEAHLRSWLDELRKKYFVEVRQKS